MSDIAEILGFNIKRLRKEKDWTQEYLAELAGISVPFMTQIELARKQASLEVVEKIARALEVPYSRLFIQENSESKEENLPKTGEELLRKINIEINQFLKSK